MKFLVFLTDCSSHLHHYSLKESGPPQINPTFGKIGSLLAWLSSSLSPSILSNIVMAPDSPRALWNSLQEAYSSTSQARLLELRHQLQTLNRDGLSCVTYISSVNASSCQSASACRLSPFQHRLDVVHPWRAWGEVQPDHGSHHQFYDSSFSL